MSIPQSMTSNCQSLCVSKKKEWKMYSLIFQQIWMCWGWQLLLWSLARWGLGGMGSKTWQIWVFYCGKSVCWVCLANYDNQSKEWPQTLSLGSPISGGCEVTAQCFSLEKNKTFTGDSLLFRAVWLGPSISCLCDTRFLSFTVSVDGNSHSSLKGHLLNSCICNNLSCFPDRQQ